jgi:hypothetical protein
MKSCIFLEKLRKAIEEELREEGCRAPSEVMENLVEDAVQRIMQCLTRMGIGEE